MGESEFKGSRRALNHCQERSKGVIEVDDDYNRVGPYVYWRLWESLSPQLIDKKTYSFAALLFIWNKEDMV